MKKKHERERSDDRGRQKNVGSRKAGERRKGRESRLKRRKIVQEINKWSGQ